MANLFLTDTYYNVFNILANDLAEKSKNINEKFIVFTEDKISLMAERTICNKIGGSFNINVISFVGLLKNNLKLERILSKEGSSMVVKKLLNNVNLKAFSKSKVNLAPSLYNLFILLKSAKVSVNDLSNALNGVDGVLKNKLEDIFNVFVEYEKYLEDNQLEDQNSILNYLPSIIENLEDIENTNVYLVGYASWTRQQRSVISSLLKKAKSVTAILTAGENRGVYLNETSFAFTNLCKEQGVELSTTYFSTNKGSHQELIRNYLFNPEALSLEKTETENVLHLSPNNLNEEVNLVATTIKAIVMQKGARFSNITIALPDVSIYKDLIKRTFNLLEIPYFIDEKKKPINHPLITLIISYMDAFRKGMERYYLSAFFKNPLFCEDKEFTDKFENYLIKYNINFFRIKEEFTFTDNLDETTFNKFKEFRAKICSFFNYFNVENMLEKLGVEEKLKEFSKKLKEQGELEEVAVNEQIYQAVNNLLTETKRIIGEEKLSVYEIKNIFVSGVNAMELSILPQYLDAVFIGCYRETALANAKYLFALGLTGSSPIYKEDVALLNDSDLNKLSEIKVLVEPKIKIVNSRIRENFGMAISSFNEKLFLSCPTYGADGKKTSKSEVMLYLDTIFNIKGYNGNFKALSKEQAILNFAKDCGGFADGNINDFSFASSVYSVLKGEVINKIIEKANKEVKIRLNGISTIKKLTSPTTLEDYFRCPYKAFVSHTLGVKERETGKVDAISVGTLMHEIFSLFVREIDKVNGLESSNQLFNSVSSTILEREEYKKFLTEKSLENSLKNTLIEAQKYCYKLYLQYSNSNFKPKYTEVRFGEGEVLPAISLAGGKVKLKGVIDRVDTYKNYCTVMDYKTGTVDSKESSLFAGVKLQLYLYSAVLKDLTPAGVYYLPVADDYKKQDKKDLPMADGKTIEDTEVLYALDKTLQTNNDSKFLPVTKDGDNFKKALTKEELQAFVNYAVAICEKGAEQMLDGVIVPSPYENTCEYCAYKGVCLEDAKSRKTNGVDKFTICDAVKEEK